MVVTFKGRQFDGETVERGTALLPPPTPVEIHQFQVLLHHIQAALAEHPQEPELLSIHFEFPLVDLLAFWEALSTPSAPYAYWEQPHPALRSLAMGQVVNIQTRGAERFAQGQRELQRWQRSMLRVSASGAPLHSTPQWLASFTFFDDFDPTPPGQETSALFAKPFAPGWIWLPRWQVCRWPDRCELWIHCQLSAPARFEPGNALEQEVRSAWDLFQQLKSLLPQGSTSFPLPTPCFSPLSPPAIHLDRFGEGVEAVLKAMQGGALQKVVLAHNLEVQAKKPFQVRQSLHNLRYYYPDCYLFCWGTPQGAHFMGASPERLLRLTQRQLQTEALAGSAPRGSTSQESQGFAQRLLANPKERHEHQLVVDFIIDQLQALGISPQRSGLPKVRQLSHIQHLHTGITAALTPWLHPLEVLAQLHPTPAVAGVPRALACNYIRQYEPYDRSLYAAPLGWIDGSGNCEFVVGIRSAILYHDRARLMAGAGIVQGSVPQREIAEVKLKLQTMLRSLA